MLILGPILKIFDFLIFGILVFCFENGFLVVDMASGRLFKRSGTKFRFRGLPEDPKIIIPDCFYEENGGMTTRRRRHDNTETPEPGQSPLLFALRDEIPREDLPSLRLHLCHVVHSWPSWQRLAEHITQFLVACCLLYTSPSPRDRQKSRMPSSA